MMRVIKQYMHTVCVRTRFRGVCDCALCLEVIDFEVIIFWLFQFLPCNAKLSRHRSIIAKVQCRHYSERTIIVEDNSSVWPRDATLLQSTVGLYAMPLYQSMGLSVRSTQAAVLPMVINTIMQTTPHVGILVFGHQVLVKFQRSYSKWSAKYTWCRPKKHLRLCTNNSRLENGTR